MQKWFDGSKRKKIGTNNSALNSPKRVLKSFAKFTGKHQWWSLVINKIVAAQVFPVNFAKFLEIPLLAASDVSVNQFNVVQNILLLQGWQNVDISSKIISRVDDGGGEKPNTIVNARKNKISRWGKIQEQTEVDWFAFVFLNCSIGHRKFRIHHYSIVQDN